MPMGGIPSLYNGEAIQPNIPYTNNMFWNTDDDVTERMFLPNGDQYNQIYNSYETIQLLDMEVHGRSGLGSAALVPGPALAPTLLPASDQLDLSFGLGLELGGSISDADLYTASEGDEVVMDFSPEQSEVQLLSAASSSNSSGGSSGSGSRRSEQRKPKKKEESGSCDECHRSFSRRSDVRRHKITAHKREAHGCPQCPTKCSRKDALLRHIRDQHLPH